MFSNGCHRKFLFFWLAKIFQTLYSADKDRFELWKCSKVKIKKLQDCQFMSERTTILSELHWTKNSSLFLSVIWKLGEWQILLIFYLRKKVVLFWYWKLTFYAPGREYLHEKWKFNSQEWKSLSLNTQSSNQQTYFYQV